MKKTIVLLPGDGIGPEVAEATTRAVDATGVRIDWQRADLNAGIITKSGQVLPPHVIESLERTHVGLKGPVTTPIAGGFQSVNVALRKQFDLYANVRPVRSLHGLKTSLEKQGRPVPGWLTKQLAVASRNATLSAAP